MSSPAAGPGRGAGVLLPCPFCGSVPVVNGSGESQRGLMIECLGKDCGVRPHTNFYDHAAARAAWNRRAAPPAQPGLEDAR